MTQKNENVKEMYEQVAKVLTQLTRESDILERITVIESKYKSGEDIGRMIWKNIRQNEENNSKDRVNWTAILQNVIIAVVSAGAVALFMGGK